MDGDAIGHRHIARHDINRAARADRADPRAHHFGDEQVAVRIECQIIGSDDRPVCPGDHAGRASGEIHRADLRTEGLRDIEFAVRAEPHPVGADHGGRRNQRVQRPAHSNAGVNGR